MKRCLRLTTALWLMVAVLTSACTPTLDWRTTALQSHGNRYTITFPGKALSAQKTVTLAGASHNLTLHAVQADTAQFALGNVAAQDAVQAQALARALAQAFATNMGGELRQTPVTIAKTLGGFDVTYPAQANRYAQARFIWTTTAAYELLAVGRPSDLTPETADTFIRSIRFE